MKLSNIITNTIVSLALLMAVSCQDKLNEPVYSQLAPDNFLNTEEGITSVLNSAFGAGFISGYDAHSVRNIENWCTDIEWETGGAEERTATLMINFTWDPATTWMSDVMWNRPYVAIRNSNTVLDNLDNVASLSTDKKSLYNAEARFMRVLSYVHLYNWYGPVPLRKSTTDSLELARATAQEMESFIESELMDIIPALPAPGEEMAYGRPNSGAAMGLLCKFYLNTRQWQKCADMAKSIMDKQWYDLYPAYEDMFKVQNERNSEFILVDPQHPNGYGNDYINGAFPTGFYKDPVSGLTMQSNWNNWAAQYRLYDSFYNSFMPQDRRKKLIITEYINNQSVTVSLLNANNTRSFKYWPDPNAISNDHGNDVAEIRYADILLSRAEALNELSGPTQEAIDLINAVRARAELTPLSLADYSSTESLRSALLLERGWEFYGEAGIRREDQIRMGTFISSAIARGHTNAQPYHVLFPIPQAALNSDASLVQNEGY